MPKLTRRCLLYNPAFSPPTLRIHFKSRVNSPISYPTVAIRNLSFTNGANLRGVSSACNVGLAELKRDSFIQSHLFTFIVGPERKSIVVHAAAIAATSQQLDALINGGMEESATRCANIEDIRADDFMRFCEYAYRGDYTVPPWEELPLEPSHTPGKKKSKKGRVPPTAWEEPAPEPEEAPAEPDPWQVPEPPPEVMSISRSPLRIQFYARNYLKDGDPKASILQCFKPKPNSASNQNFTPVFLAHARLYCFAHLRLIASLKSLTLEKLHKTLKDFKLYTNRVRDIIELVRYVYSNADLPDRGDDGTLDDLKQLVVEYIVCEIDVIGKCDEFVKYIEEGGEFVGDFWRTARNYMV